MCLKQPLGILMNEHLVKIKYYCNEKTPRCKVANSQEMADGTVGLHSANCTEVSPAACTPSFTILNRAQIVPTALSWAFPSPI